MLTALVVLGFISTDDPAKPTTPTVPPYEPIRPRSIKRDSVEVSVASVKVDKVIARVQGQTIKSDIECFQVRVSIANKSPDKTIKYLGWSTRDGSQKELNASLVDDEGDVRGRMALSSSEAAIVGANYGCEIKPGVTVTDTLTWQKPTPQCKSVQLSLPGSSIGVEGIFVFEIDREAWDAKARAERPFESLEILSCTNKGDGPKAFVRLLPSKKTLLVKERQKLNGWTIDSINPFTETITATDPKGDKKKFSRE